MAPVAERLDLRAAARAQRDRATAGVDLEALRVEEAVRASEQVGAVLVHLDRRREVPAPTEANHVEVRSRSIYHSIYQ
jgi:hypothetical protein